MSFWTKQNESIAERLPPQKLPDDFHWGHVNDQELLQFYRQHYTIGNKTITLLTQAYLDWIRSYPDNLGIVLMDDSQIIGVCFSCMFETKIGKVGHTIFLCVSSERTGQGLAGILIREIMIRGSQNGVRIGYHEVAKPIRSPMSLPGYIYPLDIKKCSRLGFVSMSGSHQQRRDRFTLPTDKDLIVSSDKSERFRSWLMSKSFGLHLTAPGLDRLLNHPEIHLSVILHTGVPQAAFIWKQNQILFTGPQKEETVLSLQLTWGELSPSYFNAAMETLPDALMIYLHRIGSVTESFLQSIHAIHTMDRYINWYNYRSVPSENFHLPCI